MEVGEIVVDREGYQGMITHDFEDGTNRVKVRKVYGLVSVEYKEDLVLLSEQKLNNDILSLETQNKFLKELMIIFKISIKLMKDKLLNF